MERKTKPREGGEVESEGVGGVIRVRWGGEKMGYKGKRKGDIRRWGWKKSEGEQKKKVADEQGRTKTRGKGRTGRRILNSLRKYDPGLRRPVKK